MVKISSLTNKKNLTTLLVAVILASGVLGFAASAESGMNYPVGSGDDDWWIAYPDQHPNAGTEVNHPEWILDAVKDEPIILLIHMTNCPACEIQEENINTVLDDMDDDIGYHEMLTENYDDIYDLLDIYDPSGRPITHSRYEVPATVFFTLVPDAEGNVHVGWYSYTNYRSEDHIRAYAEDAIDYYQENSDNWDE